MGIRLLGTLDLARSTPNGDPIAGLSGLAWDADRERLYGISDFGELFHFRPVIENGELTDVELLEHVPLRDASGHALAGVWADAEGLAAVYADNDRADDTELWVSFERRPRIWRYRTDGALIAPLSVPADLTRVETYSGQNKALEAVAARGPDDWLCAPERPLAGTEGEWVPLIAADGRRWRYPLSGEPNASVTALEVMSGGALLVLERSFVSVFRPLIIQLRRVRLGDEDPNAGLVAESIAVFDNGAGWRVDNFEGLTRQRDERYFMISDDNGNGYQRTLLMYFEVQDP
jgi:hypothetical protein